MWAPGVETDLRQGDLLVEVRVPKLSVPSTIWSIEGEEPRANAELRVPATSRACVILSQCCTLERALARGEPVCVAPLRSTKPLAPEEQGPYLSVEPPSDDEAEYVFDAHVVDPCPPAIEANVDGRLTVVDFTRTFHLQGADLWFTARRVASMTPAGRRALRISLAFYWARPERADVEELDRQGLSSGVL